MSVQVSFDRVRFRRAIERANAKQQPVAEKRIQFPCPACGRLNLVTVEQVAKQADLTCDGCKVAIGIVDKAGGFKRVLSGR